MDRASVVRRRKIVAAIFRALDSNPSRRKSKKALAFARFFCVVTPKENDGRGHQNQMKDRHRRGCFPHWRLHLLLYLESTPRTIRSIIEPVDNRIRRASEEALKGRPMPVVLAQKWNEMNRSLEEGAYLYCETYHVREKDRRRYIDRVNRNRRMGKGSLYLTPGRCELVTVDDATYKLIRTSVSGCRLRSGHAPH
jgi:hypothetical protein